MGCGGPLKDLMRVEPNLKSWVSTFKSIGIVDQDILSLYGLYAQAKERHLIGKIEVVTVFRMLEIDRLKFMFKTFAVFRRDKNEETFSDFRDFVFSLWNFCTMTVDDMAKFAFDLYDPKRAGKVDVDILVGMVKDLYGYEYRNSEVAKTAATNLQNTKKTKIDRENYILTIDKTPRLFSKLSKIQNTVRRKAIDIEFWKRLVEARYKLSEERLMKAFVDVNPDYCANKVDTSVSKSRTIMSARISPKESTTDSSTSTTTTPEPERPSILGMRLFKKPIGETRLAKRKAVKSSRSNAIQRALALDQILKEQRAARRAAREAKTAPRPEPLSASTTISPDKKAQDAPQPAPAPAATPLHQHLMDAPPPSSLLSRYQAAFAPMQTHVEGVCESTDQSASGEILQRQQSQSYRFQGGLSMNLLSSIEPARHQNSPASSLKVFEHIEVDSPGKDTEHKAHDEKKYDDPKAVEDKKEADESKHVENCSTCEKQDFSESCEKHDRLDIMF